MSSLSSIDSAQHDDVLAPGTTICALEECSFSDEAAHTVAAQLEQAKVRNVQSIGEVWQATREGETGLVPFENSNAGVVWPHLNELRRGMYRIVGEVSHPVEMCAGTHDGVDIAKATNVYSHHKALEQSSAWLNAHPHLAANAHFNSTVDAVRFVSEHPEILGVALGTRSAMQKHGLQLVGEDIADTPAQRNITRMFLLQNNGHSELPDEQMANHAAVVQLENYDGSLHDALGIVRQAAGLSSIHSRNTGDMEYEFFLRMAKRHPNDPDSTRRFRNMVDALHALVGRERVRWLGSWNHNYQHTQS